MTEEQKARMEAMQKQMEEQKASRMAQMELSLKQLKVNKNLVHKTIDKLKADREVVEKVDMVEEKNEIKKKALEAQLGELDALVETEEFKLEMISFNNDALKSQMDQLEKMPASAMMQQAMMQQGMGR